MTPSQKNDETFQTIINPIYCVDQSQNIAAPVKTNPIMGTNKKSKSVLEQQHIQDTNTYLNINIIQKMLNKFLTEKNIPKEKLAEALGVSIKELEDLWGNQNTSLIPKINLPLIKLYCETKWL